MTKEEVIKEAWGEYYESIKHELDEHGRYNYYDCIEEVKRRKLWQFENISITEVVDYLLIPTSIKGIERNNGWIKVQSEEDLPKTEMQDCFIMDKTLGVIVGRFTLSEKNIWLENATYYQPIEKPKPPIY